jgi:hypothetical protein
MALEDIRFPRFDCHFCCPSNFFKTTLPPYGATLDNFAKGGTFSINQAGESALPYWNETDPKFRCLLEGIDDSTQ